MTVPAESVRELLAPPRGCGCPEKVLLCCWCGLWSVQREKVTGYHIHTTTSYTHYHKLILHFHSTHTQSLPSFPPHTSTHAEYLLDDFTSHHSLVSLLQSNCCVSKHLCLAATQAIGHANFDETIQDLHIQSVLRYRVVIKATRR